MSRKIVQAEATSIQERPLNVIAEEIREIDLKARQVVGQSIIEIGTRLIEAKNMVEHGQWGDWLKNNVNYSQSTANNFMRIATEFTEMNSQALANLSYTKAVALLGLPAEEREEFAEKNDIESMSSRELQAAIKEKQELERKLQEAQRTADQEKAAREALAASMAKLQEQQQAHDELVKKLTADVESAQAAKDNKAAEAAKEQLKKAKEELAELKKRNKDLETELKNIRSTFQRKSFPMKWLKSLKAFGSKRNPCRSF
ncbi:DUF3102 domain-containing protein [Paenibacillus silviterrae]|uniref:DUF3102 domain-containing protein n=1 Tax=Paenibacillus silviterrae TaxID=3242194 RepID=UPI002543B592|nr:DUF3102 domain-containing protein [Paenibacillus chinjuensis]